MTTPKPRRRHKGDKLLHPGADRRDIMVDYALGPFDRLSDEMSRKWGVDRLPELVSPATAQRFGSAMHRLNEAIEKGRPADGGDHKVEPDYVRICAENCMRGLQAMDREAEEAGMPKADPNVWEYELDGMKFGIMADDRAWQSIKKQRPDLILVTMREVAIALKAYKFDGVVEEVKKHFPAATVTNIRPKEKNMDDPIQFGEVQEDLF
jgi:hypothetical protein